MTQPIRNIPKDLLNEFTMNNKIPVYDYYFEDDNNTHFEWSNDLIDKMLLYLTPEKIKNKEHLYYDIWKRGEPYPEHRKPGGPCKLYTQAFEKYNIENKDIAVIGSTYPWLECISLNFKANSVTTVEYLLPKVNYPKMKAISYYKDFKNSNVKYDCILSFSSIEHSGLGRYSDTLDPNGDIKVMEEIYDNLNDDGLLFLGVPVGNDALAWNANRIYGSIRLPLLFEKFEVLEWFGCTLKDCLKLPKGKDWKSNYQPVIVLKKKKKIVNEQKEQKILIGYLTDKRRLYSFEQFVNFLNKIKFKQKIKLLILLNIYSKKDETKKFLDNIINKKLVNVDYEIISFENKNNYIEKIKYLINYGKNNNFKYCLKYDNDLIINNYTLDYLIENASILENPDNLFISPILSSGIPTVDLFIDCFFDEKEKDNIKNIFKNTVMPNNLWGCDYSKLNKHTVEATEWDINKYLDTLDSLKCHFKGIHPIRINKEAISYMNSIILKYKHKIYEKQDYKMKITNTFPYFCNSIFLIKTKIYDKIVTDETLFVDAFDEVPVNKYCKLNKLNSIFIMNSFSIHPIYNSIKNYSNLEEILFKNIFK